LFCVPFFAVACAALHAAQTGPSAQALDALAGEYAEPAEPDTPEDIYVRDGRLIFESEVFAPTELIPETTTRFRLAGSRTTMQFTLDGSGRGSSVVSSSSPSVLYLRTGNPVRHVFHDYQRTEVMIPMRDGVKLHAVILKPTDMTAPVPFLMQRTPYGVDGTTDASFQAQRPELASGGYIYVAEDIRGRFKSQG